MRVESCKLPAKYRLGSALFIKSEAMIRAYHAGKDFKFIHVRAVMDNALMLAHHYGANCSVVGWAALLHDIASAKYDDPSPRHPKRGAEEAKKYLKQIGLPSSAITDIARCIKEHGADGKPRTLAAKIVRAADNLAALNTFFDINFSFCMSKARKGQEIDYLTGLREGHKWAQEKIDATVQKISGLDHAMLLGKEKLEAAQLILDSMADQLAQRQGPLSDPKMVISAFFEVVFSNCLSAAEQGAGINANKGLYDGFYRTQRMIDNAWNSMSLMDKGKYGKLYHAEQVILRAMEPYLKDLV